MQSAFVVAQKSLVSILSSMQPICTKRTTLDATTSILFQVGHRELVLKSTDLEISLQASYLLDGNGPTETQSFLVSGKRIFDLVKELDGNIEFVLKGNQLSLRSGGVNLSLHIKDAQEFPPFPERIENLMQLDAPFLLEMLDKVSFLIPQSTPNVALQGMLLEISASSLTMTTTDGHCLAQVSSPRYTLEAPRTWLLPRRAIFEVKKILEGSEDKTVFLGVCGNQLVFSGESFNFFTRLLNNTFPNYAAVLDKKDFIPASVDRSHFIKTLRRSACLLSGQFIATQFGFSSQSLDVSMHNKEVGSLQEMIPLSAFEGAPVDIRFYAPYLLNGLQVFDESVIHFYIKGSAKPVIFESSTADHRVQYLVMPVSPTAA